ncbi:MFS transporter [Novosphingobium pokkalii]|uniref:MFS transporter n=1 Tax=Novosphingobium pokkalii TaxID=1770194 RepID=UPI00363E0EEB
MSDPEVNLDLTGRSGPIIVQLEYRVAPQHARAFYRAMQAVRSVRRRNGAFDWSLSRDIADAELWLERDQCPTWHDYLRQRDRSTPDELDTQLHVRRYLREGSEIRLRRLLERPFGSVRWADDVPESPVTTTG